MFTTSRLFIPILLSFAVFGCFCLPNLQVRHFVLVVSRMRIAFDRRVGGGMVTIFKLAMETG
jgi:hypothetical protein